MHLYACLRNDLYFLFTYNASKRKKTQVADRSCNREIIGKLCIAILHNCNCLGILMAATRGLSQGKEALLKSYTTRLKDDVKSMLENFDEIMKLGKGENSLNESQLSRMAQCEQDTLEMHVRAANMVRAGESLMKLVSDIKQYLILNDFPSVNDAIQQNSKLFRTKQAECDQKLASLRDDMAADLYDLEEEYYTSVYKGK